MPAVLAEIPLSLFGGYDSELAPPDIPEGVSPGNQDMAYLPGSAFTRPGVHKIYTSFGAQTILYAKKYVEPNGSPLNLLLTSAGNLYVEDPVNTPGIFTLLGTTTPGAVARSITAFGREYIAISDGVHGLEVPLQYDGTNLDRVTQDGPGSAPTITNTILPAQTLTALVRSNNVVHGTTSAAHGLQIGYQAQISGVAANQVGGGITTVVINNEDAPGLATITTATAHGLVPGLFVSLSGIQSASVGGGIVSISRAGQVVTVITASAHNLSPGSIVTINAAGNPTLSGTFTVAAITSTTSFTYIQAGNDASSAGGTIGGGIASLVRSSNVVTLTTFNANGVGVGATITVSGCSDTSFNGTFVVSSVTNPTTFVYSQNAANATVSNSGTLSAVAGVSLDWPVPSTTTTPTYFEVIAAPTSTTFQVAVNYSDGSWTAGTVSYAWDGTFYVTGIPTTTTFTYQQYGPGATASSFGQVTPYGQAAPGKHQMQVLFLTRQGAITKPSPPVSFIANGGQYLSVSNIPIGPPNVVARILAFTGAAGAYFFYIATPATIDNQIVSTATQINDNTSTTVLLDFSDNTLFAAQAINIPGNNLPNQIVLGPCLGVFAYASRLFWWGDRNRITNLLNMGFDGGYLPLTSTLPTGWTSNGDPGGALATGHFGVGYQISVTSGGGHYGTIYQLAQFDYLGIPVAQPNQPYRLRLWIRSNTTDAGLNFQAYFQSGSTGYTSTATINGASMSTAGGWVEIAFSLPMPASIPSDFIFAITGFSASVNATLLVDELSVLYAQSPYNLSARASYVENPEGIDGVTGNIGPASDPTGVLNLFEIRDELYFQTSGRLHQTVDSPDLEPSSWNVRQVASDCGALSAFCTDTGEDWAVWASQSGLRGFAGGEPAKLSQEIQTLWAQINTAAQKTVWVKNDPINRRMFLGIPTGINTLPNVMYVLDYRENDLMSQIIAASPVRISYTGRMISSDLGRKWSIWNLPMATCALLYQGGQDVFCFGGVGTGNMYYLDSAKLTDDDFGIIPWFYITYGFVNHDQEQALQLGSQRKLYKTMNLFVSGVGYVTITPLVDTLVNARPTRPLQLLSNSPTKDLSWGLNVAGERTFFKISGSPLTGQTDSYANLQKLMVRMVKHPVSPNRSAV